jgi:hypothetical protein
VAHLAAEGEQARREKLGTVGEQAKRLGSDQIAAEVAQARNIDRKNGNGSWRRALQCMVAHLGVEGEQTRRARNKWTGDCGRVGEYARRRKENGPMAEVVQASW